MAMRRISRTTWAVIVVWVVFASWILAGIWFTRGAGGAYRVTERHDGYELRTYAPRLVAEVDVAGSWSAAVSDGADALTRYFRGDNIRQEAAAMAGTSVGAGASSEAIAHSFALGIREEGGTVALTADVPASYTVVTLPRPNDARIRIVEVPEETVAVRGFRGPLDSARSLAAQNELSGLLDADGRAIIGPASVTAYSPSWVPPFLQRDEVMVPVR